VFSARPLGRFQIPPFQGMKNSYAVRMRMTATSGAVFAGHSHTDRTKKWALLAALIVLLFVGCEKPSDSRSYPSPDSELSYRVDRYRGHGALDPSSMRIFAVLQTKEGHGEELVLSGMDIDLDSISWRTENEGFLCLSGGYTETYRRIVALSVGSKTLAIYTHLSDGC
jgi:hypothetical protein